jgi:hypothetical protein
MEQSQRRTAVIAAVRKRVLGLIAHRLDDRGVLQIALASALRDPEDLIGMLFPAHVAKIAIKNLGQLALTHTEWCDLFGGTTGPLRDTGLSNVVQSLEFRPYVTAIGTAMRTTVAEEQQARAWARPWCQALCYVGVHLEDPHKSIASVIGQVVTADLRRLEELHAQIDDDGYAIMLMSKIIIALASSII